MTADWENARCMHGNLPDICFVISCVARRRFGGVDYGQAGRIESSDLVEVQETNRRTCSHPEVPRALGPAEEEAELGAGMLMGRFVPVLCTTCNRIVPTRPAPAKPARVLSAVP